MPLLACSGERTAMACTRSRCFLAARVLARLDGSQLGAKLLRLLRLVRHTLHAPKLRVGLGVRSVSFSPERRLALRRGLPQARAMTKKERQLCAEFVAWCVAQSPATSAAPCGIKRSQDWQTCEGSLMDTHGKLEPSRGGNSFFLLMLACW